MKKNLKKMSNFAFFYGIGGILLGAFYREYTKFLGFTGETRMSIAHTHTLTLGFIMTLIILLLENSFKLSEDEKFKNFYTLYNVSVIGIITTFMVKGFLDIAGYEMVGGVLGAFNGIAGILHIILTYSVYSFMKILKRRIETM